MRSQRSCLNWWLKCGSGEIIVPSTTATLHREKFGNEHKQPNADYSYFFDDKVYPPANSQCWLLLISAIKFGQQTLLTNNQVGHFTFCLLLVILSLAGGWKIEFFNLHFGEIYSAILRNPFCNLENQFGHASFSSCNAFIGRHDPGWKKSLNQISKRISDACNQRK